VSDPELIDWWKMWELNAGFDLGLLYAVTFYVLLRKGYLTNGYGKVSDDKTNSERYKTVLMAVVGFVLIFITGFEYFFWTGLVLSLFYFFVMLVILRNAKDAPALIERRKNILFVFSVFFLLFILFFGGSERLGIVLDLYSLDEVSQYSWPVERIFIFLPFAVVITGFTFFKMREIILSSYENKILLPSYKIMELITILGFVGAMSIWPSKIGIIYALFIVVSVYAVNSLENRINTR